LHLEGVIERFVSEDGRNTAVLDGRGGLEVIIFSLFGIGWVG